MTALVADFADRISRAVDDLRAELLEDIRAVVRIPSVVGSEHAMQAAIEELYVRSGIGFEISRLVPDAELLAAHPLAVDTGLSLDGRYNVVAELPGDETARSLILNGHIDVVAPGEASQWRHDPWSGAIDGEWLYGRGAGDMKAGLIANLHALKALRRAGLKPKGRVCLQAVIDEEAGGSAGTLACFLAGSRADAMICTEPHDLNVTVAHAGVAYFRVRVEGRGAHAGQAHRGVNAIVKAMPIVAALETLGLARAQQARHPRIDVGGGQSCHLNIGTMRAGEWPSSVPGSAVIECRIGFVPGEFLEEIRATVERTIFEAASGDAWLKDHPPVLEWFGWQAEPWEQDADHPFVSVMRTAVCQATGNAPRLIGRAAGLDTRFAGHFGVPAVCFGPRVENMHGIDERVHIPSVVATVETLALAIANWCGVEETEDLR